MSHPSLLAAYRQFAGRTGELWMSLAVFYKSAEHAGRQNRSVEQNSAARCGVMDQLVVFAFDMQFFHNVRSCDNSNDHTQSKRGHQKCAFDGDLSRTDRRRLRILKARRVLDATLHPEKYLEKKVVNCSVVFLWEGVWYYEVNFVKA